jgi:HIRAN domain
VGMAHRLTMSTRRMLRDHVDEAPVTCTLVRESDNFMDKNAIMVMVADQESPYHGMHIGYLMKEVAAWLAPQLDEEEIIPVKTLLLKVHPDNGTGDLNVKVKSAG